MGTQLADTRQVIDRHVKALMGGHLDELVSDYTDDALLLTPNSTVKGKDAIRSAFEGYLAGLFKPGTYRMTADALRVEGDVACIAWHAECAAADIPFGTDTFVLRDGKIVIQTFAAKVDRR